ncbi:hypothetical protein [Mesorhizobium huakuii]|uniref:Uncharacterized protein n=1 Tax=Mesorhizobium huakuii TaxID=28104 RepID=A0A7G6SRE8_9HYPH|nr:hypothetical protein [Mesorhizobium huakuii]QND57080.1 hypothetical protein HB778_10985 [Mesorhizobium huakuii]
MSAVFRPELRKNKEIERLAVSVKRSNALALPGHRRAMSRHEAEKAKKAGTEPTFPSTDHAPVHPWSRGEFLPVDRALVNEALS